ncbi:MAG: methionyl-tRNA formyltransferase [Bacteroidales bacterium]|nr:methionyl-tRNA formyltransferase [Bacteroidales bacterium]
MGTPEFAVPSLRSLHNAGCDIAAVVTVPDRAAGRGRKITFSPVKEYALEHNLYLLQPEKLRDPAFISEMQSLKADLFVVVAFRMLPEIVWRIPPLGTFNLHASLLPQYRGAAPINHAIINGETRTGVTTFLIDSKIDTGMILLSRETEINPDENAGSLHDRLKEIGAGITVATARGLYAGKLKPVPQKKIPPARLTTAPRIFPADTIINWREPAVKVHNLIRGLSPYPGAMTLLHRGDSNLRLKILESKLIDDIREIPGLFIRTEKSRLIVSCVSGAIEILSLVPEGRKKMSGSEFLRGFDPSGWELA